MAGSPYSSRGVDWVEGLLELLVAILELVLSA